MAKKKVQLVGTGMNTFSLLYILNLMIIIRGAVALFIASKLEQVYAPALEEFVFVCDNTYTKDEVNLQRSCILPVQF